MKVLTIIFTFILITHISNAQTIKGTYLLGGDASYQTSEGDVIFTLNPNIGYFVVDKFVTGLSVSYYSYRNTKSIGLNPFLRSYFLTSDRGSAFGGIGVIYVRQNSNDNIETLYGYNLKLGYAIFLNRSIALEASANYANLVDKSPININEKLFSFNVGFQIHFNQQ
ncbi:MAG TPA: hypothetical protein PKD51_16130 [Saprospiraceae bacterium]|nr:hypothetical protein [Saprospiraceae bacterium]HMU05295.1 hypothetical protein [Saprospiraceae bacterium]